MREPHCIVGIPRFGSSEQRKRFAEKIHIRIQDCRGEIEVGPSLPK